MSYSEYGISVAVDHFRAVIRPPVWPSINFLSKSINNPIKEKQIFELFIAKGVITEYRW